MLALANTGSSGSRDHSDPAAEPWLAEGLALDDGDGDAASDGDGASDGETGDGLATRGLATDAAGGEHAPRLMTTSPRAALSVLTDLMTPFLPSRPVTAGWVGRWRIEAT